MSNVLKLAIIAVGGQGGGVLTGWIETMVRAQGFVCQATSVAGVAQRTGSTIYYIEMAPRTEQDPVFALAPSAGDVDIMIAAEMMEVGRSIQRGFVTPNLTTLIGSTHRAPAVSEKITPGNGIANSDEVRAAAEIAAQRLILADMDRLATEQGSVISASLFGALAGSAALPFDRAAFEDSIRASGKGVEASLRAFSAGYDVAQSGAETLPTSATHRQANLSGPASRLRAWEALLRRTESFPLQSRDLIQAGVAKLVDFQDCKYAAEYLDRMERVLALDTSQRDWELTSTAAKYLANAMAYDDIIRVADLKTRAPRMSRIKREMNAESANTVQLTEYFHPRAEEIAGMLPARIGQRVVSNSNWMARLNRWFGKGKRLRTDRLPAFLMLHILGGLKQYRLRTHRHAVETRHLDGWLERALAPAKTDYALSVELFKNRRLIKGYSDTHTRGHSKFDQVMGTVTALNGRSDAAQWIARLREAALQDPEGKALAGALQTIASFTPKATELHRE